MNSESENDNLEESEDLEQKRNLSLIDSYSIGVYLTYLKYAATGEEFIGEVGNGGIIHN